MEDISTNTGIISENAAPSSETPTLLAPIPTTRKRRQRSINVNRPTKRQKQESKDTLSQPRNCTHLEHIEEMPNSTSECAICMTPFTGKMIGTPQNCEHNFCLDCIQKWSKVKSSCPLDRKNFNSIAVRKEIGGRVIRKISNRKKPRRNTQRLTRNEIFLIGYNIENFNMAEDILP